MEVPATVRPEWLFELANRAQALAFDRRRFDEAEDLCSLLQIPPPMSAAEERLLRRFCCYRPPPPPADEKGPQEQGPGYHDDRDSRIREAVGVAADLLHRESATHWTLESLSRRVGCNRTDLEAAFRRHTRWSIHAYLTQRRVDAARDLLHTGNWRILEIARAVGYRTKASLCRACKQTLAMTPEQYRSRWQPKRVNQRLAELLDLNRDCQN